MRNSLIQGSRIFLDHISNFEIVLGALVTKLLLWVWACQNTKLVTVIPNHLMLTIGSQLCPGLDCGDHTILISHARTYCCCLIVTGSILPYQEEYTR